jgi:hypothetical protein
MLVQTEINEIDNILNINDKGLITAFSNSNEEKKKFVYNIAYNMAIKYETSIAILNSSINKNNLKEVQKLLRKASTNVLVNSASSYTLNELIEKCKYVKSNKNIKVIIIDEINTITNFEKEQAEIFSKLKELATTLNICILVIC